MNKAIFLILVLAVVGCTYEGKSLSSYIEEPKWLLKDPHYAAYKEERDTLESQYLQKDITYADYMKQKQMLEDKYDKEVQDRNAITSH